MSERHKGPFFQFFHWVGCVAALPFLLILLLVVVVVKLVTVPFAKPYEAHDYTEEAQALFTRFAERHGLSYEIESGVPMEVCWIFPEQPKLSMPITLGLQNYDELNFGVSDFWSYFFPFAGVSDEFERIIDAWVMGDARVAITGFRSRLLQVREGTQWKTVYGADGILFLLRWAPLSFVKNDPAMRG